MWLDCAAKNRFLLKYKCIGSPWQSMMCQNRHLSGAIAIYRHRMAQFSLDAYFDRETEISSESGKKCVERYFTLYVTSPSISYGQH
jgi:hypothetical protein